MAELGAVEAEDSDLASGDEHDDAPASVGVADADVVEAAVVAEQGLRSASRATPFGEPSPASTPNNLVTSLIAVRPDVGFVR